MKLFKRLFHKRPKVEPIEPIPEGYIRVEQRSRYWCGQQRVTTRTVRADDRKALVAGESKISALYLKLPIGAKNAKTYLRQDWYFTNPKPHDRLEIAITGSIESLQRYSDRLVQLGFEKYKPELVDRNGYFIREEKPYWFIVEDVPKAAHTGFQWISDQFTDMGDLPCTILGGRLNYDFLFPDSKDRIVVTECGSMVSNNGLIGLVESNDPKEIIDVLSIYKPIADRHCYKDFKEWSTMEDGQRDVSFINDYYTFRNIGDDHTVAMLAMQVLVFFRNLSLKIHYYESGLDLNTFLGIDQGETNIFGHTTDLSYLTPVYRRGPGFYIV